MSSDYLAWCERIKARPANEVGGAMKSANKIRVVNYDTADPLIFKAIRPDVPYIPRIKAMGEVAYGLLDYHLDTEDRVAPNVYATSPDTIWRQYLTGDPGEDWRALLYRQRGTLEGADLVIVDCILASRSAQRIALLDFITVCQDRSARNWITTNGVNFYAIDNGLFWPYRGRFGDKLALKTGDVSHLNPPMAALISKAPMFEFAIGVFTSLHSGRSVDAGLLHRLAGLNWAAYLSDLGSLICGPLGYPTALMDDWRFSQMRQRAEWILKRERFPSKSEILVNGWQSTINTPAAGKHVWRRQWEMSNLEMP